jgi:NAD(P)H-dependent flavin oxidoreductase YrpB (nitropropane dioxygenase family)
VIAQGLEAGGHVRGTVSAAELLERVRAAVGTDYPVLSAGGITSGAEVAERLQAGAEAVVSGTRFLMSEESGAHPDYKERLIGARQTTVTELFGLGWPAPHRVVPNAATERWLRGDRRGPGWVRAIHRLSSVGASRVPIGLQLRLAASQRPGLPFFGPAAATADGPATLVDAGPLYAGECIARIDDVRPAGELVRELG